MTWWRNQRVALISLLLAVAATVGVHLWLNVLPSLENETVTHVSPGQRAEVAGQRISVTSVRGDEFDAPTGMRTISVHLNARGNDDATSCGAFTLAEPSTGRVWMDARSELDVPYDAGESSCLSESAPYKILAVFLVPENAIGPFLFDVPGSDDVARFTVEP